MSSSVDCINLAIELAKLQKQNAVLKKRLDKKLSVICRQRSFLDTLRTFVWAWVCEAKKMLDRKSGVERGRWAYAKGLGYAAGNLYAILMVDYSALVKDLL